MNDEFNKGLILGLSMKPLPVSVVKQEGETVVKGIRTRLLDAPDFSTAKRATDRVLSTEVM